MSPPPYAKGNWFHSRSSSSEGERDKIVILVEVSQKSQYQGVRWSGNPDSPNLVAFSDEISVDAATMQTKVRQFIRLGYLKDDSFLPLKWTRLGELWRGLSKGTRRLKGNADDFEKLIITYGLALYAFDLDGYSKNPTRGYRPLLALLQEVGSSDFISKDDLLALVGETNYTYWRLDLLRAGILQETRNGFKVTGKFSDLINAVRTTTLPTGLSEDDWVKIHNDALNPKNPYRDAINTEVGRILEGVLSIESVLSTEEKTVVSSIVSLSSIEEQAEIDAGDYKVDDSYTTTKVRRKQAAWSNKVKENYGYACCVPGCDVNTPELITASHIKSYSEPESGSGHRADPRNGLCLCYLCHALFDNGYFTLTQDLKIEVSPQASNITSRIVNDILRNSHGKKIAPTPQAYTPRSEYIDYHRNNVFKQ